jgi:hypothetical protein
VISALARDKTRESKSASKKQVIYTGKKSSFSKQSFKHKFSPQSKTKYFQCQFSDMKVHKEDTCHFKVKAMQEAQRKTKQKAQQKPKATSSETIAVEHAEMSEF